MLVCVQVMSDFKDTLGPLNQLTESAKASLGEFTTTHSHSLTCSPTHSPTHSLPLSCLIDTPGREAKFETSVDTFKAHSSQMARTAANLAKSGGITDKKVADDLITSSSKVMMVVLVNIVLHLLTSFVAHYCLSSQVY